VKRSAATGCEADYDSPDEMRAFQRVMRRVVSWLPQLDEHIAGREHQVIVVAVEGDDDRVTVTVADSPEHALRIVGPRYDEEVFLERVRTLLRDREPRDVAIVIRRDGAEGMSVLFHAVTRVRPVRGGSA
jgi:hypothetical protein